MLCAKNWACSKFVSVSDAWHAPDDFFSGLFLFRFVWIHKTPQAWHVCGVSTFVGGRLRRGWCVERCRGQKPARGIFQSISCSLGALAYNSAHDERTRHTISQSRARRVGWSMALASSLLSELEAPFSCTRMTKRRKALIFRRLEASPISANYVRHARKAVPCSSPMNSSTLLKSNSKP